MELSFEFLVDLFAHSFSFWWIILPAIFMGLIVGAIPGFSAANTIIILLPLTLAMGEEVGLVFMVALYCSSRMGAGIPAILVNVPGTAGAAATPLDGYPMADDDHRAIRHAVCGTGGLLPA
jgi:putative tricarboxylic transport membrane protein